MDIKLILSIYAGLLSTFVFLWRLYEFFDDKRGKIKVRLNLNHQALVYGNKTLGELEAFYVATITNVGKYRRHMEKPAFITNIPVDNQNYFSIINFEAELPYPYSLEPGQKFEYKIPAESIISRIKPKGVTRIKIVVFDTYGKSYKSNWQNV